MTTALDGRALVVGEADQGPFDLAALLLGPEPFLIALMDPEQHAGVLRLLEYCTQQSLRYALAQAAAGADFVEIGDSTAGPDVCSPRIYRKFAYPFEVRLAADLAAHGVPLVLHICGNTTAIMADMAATGAGAARVRLQGRHGALPGRRGRPCAGGQHRPQRCDGARYARTGVRRVPPGDPGAGRQRPLHPQPRLHPARHHPRRRTSRRCWTPRPDGREVRPGWAARVRVDSRHKAGMFHLVASAAAVLREGLPPPRPARWEPPFCEICITCPPVVYKVIRAFLNPTRGGPFPTRGFWQRASTAMQHGDDYHSLTLLRMSLAAHLTTWTALL